MQEFSSISVSSYDAGSLAGRLTEQSQDGWAVVAIVPAGSSVIAYLSRELPDAGADSDSDADTAGDDAVSAVDGADAGDAGHDEPTTDHHDSTPAADEPVLAAADAVVPTLGSTAGSEATDHVGAAADTAAADTAEADTAAADTAEADTAAADTAAADTAVTGGDDATSEPGGWAAGATATAGGASDTASDWAHSASDRANDAATGTAEQVEATDHVDAMESATSDATSDAADDADAAIAGLGESVSDSGAEAANTATDSVGQATDAAAVAVDDAASGAQATAGAAPAGWYADPSSRFELRYWDGSQWTEHVSRSGQQFTDPPVA